MKVIIAGGGTYGHIAPGLALFHEFKKRGHDVIYICSKRDVNYKTVNEIKDKVKVIPVTPFKRYDIPAKIIFGFNFLRGIFKSRRIIKKFKPDVLIGVGGYVAGAPLMVLRKKKKIKKIILEQNTLPGAVNRYFSQFVDLTILTFEMSKKWIKGNSIVMGNPVLIEKKDKAEKEAKDYFNINKSEFVLSVVGGSAGAKIINDTFLSALDKLNNITIIWSTGVNHYDEIKEKINSYKNIKLYPFIDRMDYLLNITDLLISRAGATSISEICYMGVPAILIPYKWASEDHQKHNAEFVVNGGGGIMIEEDYFTPEGLAEIVLKLIKDKETLIGMKKNIQQLFPVDVTKQIVDKIGEICSIK